MAVFLFMNRGDYVRVKVGVVDKTVTTVQIGYTMYPVKGGYVEIEEAKAREYPNIFMVDNLDNTKKEEKAVEETAVKKTTRKRTTKKEE